MATSSEGRGGFLAFFTLTSRDFGEMMSLWLAPIRRYCRADEVTGG